MNDPDDEEDNEEDRMGDEESIGSGVEFEDGDFEDGDFEDGDGMAMIMGDEAGLST